MTTSEIGERLRSVFGSTVRGPLSEELRIAQRTVILSRVVALVWIAAFMIPFAVFVLVGVTSPSRLRAAATIVALSFVGIFTVRALVKRGLFDRHYHLAALLLVGCVFGAVASSVCEVVRADGASFYFAYFLICLALVTLLPLDALWVLGVSAALICSYVLPTVLRAGFSSDATFRTNVIYLIDLTVLNVAFNRIVTTMFFAEQRARIELRTARDALRGEIAIAQEIQTLLLPREPTWPRHRLHGVMIPAEEVGGDYFDVVETSAGRRFVAVGDVSGHGVTSGLTMMMARSSLLGALESDPDGSLEGLYAALNTALRRNLERMKLSLFMTFTLIEDRGNGHYRAVGAHLPILVWRAATRSIDEIRLDGVWLGVLDTITRDMSPVHEIELREGDHFLLYTDGIIESMRGDELFGIPRLKSAFEATAPSGPEAVVAAILGAVESFGGDRSDDRTLLAVQYMGDANTPSLHVAA